MFSDHLEEMDVLSPRIRQSCNIWVSIFLRRRLRPPIVERRGEIGGFCNPSPKVQQSRWPAPFLVRRKKQRVPGIGLVAKEFLFRKGILVFFVFNLFIVRNSFFSSFIFLRIVIVAVETPMTNPRFVQNARLYIYFSGSAFATLGNFAGNMFPYFADLLSCFLSFPQIIEYAAEGIYHLPPNCLPSPLSDYPGTQLQIVPIIFMGIRTPRSWRDRHAGRKKTSLQKIT